MDNPIDDRMDDRMDGGLWRIRVAAPGAAADAFEAAIEQFCTALTRTEGDGGRWRLEGLCATRPDPATLAIAVELAAAAEDMAVPEVHVEAVAPRDWVADNLAQFPPIAIGRFFIHGSHFDGPPPPSRIGLWVDPAVAFGSGRHGSTSGCLVAIGHLSRRRFARALDMGCGSGILAIAIAKAWRVPVVAADIDAASIGVTRTNARLNGVGDRVRAVRADGYAAPLVRRLRPFDLVVCNILARPLKRMARDLSAHLAPGGIAVLSGFLTRDGDDVLAAHRAVGLRLRRRITIDDWQTLIVERPAGPQVSRQRPLAAR